MLLLNCKFGNFKWYFFIVICSELECENEVYSVHQLEARGVDENLNGDENIIEEETFEETLVQDIVNELIPEDTSAVKVEANILMDADEITPPQRTSPLTVAETILKERLPEAKREILFQVDNNHELSSLYIKKKLFSSLD